MKLVLFARVILRNIKEGASMLLTVLLAKKDSTGVEERRHEIFQSTRKGVRANGVVLYLSTHPNLM